MTDTIADLPRLIELQRTAAPDCEREDGWNAGLDRAAAIVREALTPNASVPAELVERARELAFSGEGAPDLVERVCLSLCATLCLVMGAFGVVLALRHENGWWLPVVLLTPPLIALCAAALGARAQAKDSK